MKQEFRPAIEALQCELQEYERKAAETKHMINRLCELAGAAPIYADIEGPELRALSTRSDRFYGKVLTTAMREYLDMRNSADLGPASPREIYDALVDGGFKFDVKVPENALANIRATLRKNSSIFHRLPNNEYGLLAWYPNAKTARQEEDEGDASTGPKRKANDGTTTRKPKPSTAKKPKLPITPFVLDAMADGMPWDTEKLKRTAIVRQVPGVSETTKRNVFHGALLSLKNQGRVRQTDDGKWVLEQIAAPNPTSADVIPMKGTA